MGTDSPEAATVDGVAPVGGGGDAVVLTAAKVAVAAQIGRRRPGRRGSVMTGPNPILASLCRRDRRKRENLVAYIAHGLTISSHVPLPGLAETVPPGDTFDLTIRASAWSDDAVVVDGTVIARDVTPGRSLEIVRDVNGEWTVVGEGVVMRIDAHGTMMDVGCDDERSGAVGWLVGGLGLAVVLTARGEQVLHGSHVESGGRGVLMMAPSGHGKSVSAAAACALGGRLVAEDTVTVDPPDSSRPGSAYRVRSGSTVLRTRRTVEEMGEWFPAGGVSRSSDGRTLVRPGDGAASRGARSDEGASLDRLVFLKLDAHAAEARVDEVEPMSALANCLAQLRIPGLVDPDETASAFERVAALVDSVPARVFVLPWNGGLAGFTDDVGRCLEAC